MGNMGAYNNTVRFNFLPFVQQKVKQAFLLGAG